MKINIIKLILVNNIMTEILAKKVNDIKNQKNIIKVKKHHENNITLIF